MVFALEGGYRLAYVGHYNGTIQDTSSQSGPAEIYKITGQTIKPLPNAAPGFEPYVDVVLVPGVDTTLNKKTITFMFFSSPLHSDGASNSSDDGPDITTTYEEP